MVQLLGLKVNMSTKDVPYIYKVLDWSLVPPQLIKRIEKTNRSRIVTVSSGKFFDLYKKYMKFYRMPYIKYAINTSWYSEPLLYFCGTSHAQWFESEIEPYKSLLTKTEKYQNGFYFNNWHERRTVNKKHLLASINSIINELWDEKLKINRNEYPKPWKTGEIWNLET